MKMTEQEREIMYFNRFVEDMFAKCSFNEPWDFERKGQTVFTNAAYMLDRLQMMFKYKGLPETITKRNLELLMMVNGYAGFAEVKGDLYAFRGGLGGEPDPYYMPTLFTVANPALDFSGNLKIDEECVIIPNDSLYLGIMPLINKYTTLQTEGEISLRIALINSRIASLISAPDDATKTSAEKYIRDIVAGKLGVIGDNFFLEGIKSQPYASTGNSNNIQSVIEGLQYVRATMFNEIGLSANFNMKREALNSAESALNNDILIPLIDNMLENRQEGLERVNKMFGTDISVSLASSWEDNQEEIDSELEEADPETKEEPETEKESEPSDIEQIKVIVTELLQKLTGTEEPEEDPEEKEDEQEDPEEEKEEDPEETEKEDEEEEEEKKDV